jgi:hypothetical protein
LNGSTDTFNASKNYPSELTLDSSTTSLPRSQFATPVLTHGPFARLGLNNRSSGIMNTSLNNNNKRGTRNFLNREGSNPSSLSGNCGSKYLPLDI